MSALLIRTNLTVLAVLSSSSLACGATSIVKEAAQQGPVKEDAGMGMVDPCDEFTNPGHLPGPDAGAPMATDPACDMTGLWAARMTTWAEGFTDTLGGNWYYFELAQYGEDVVVVDHFDCGLEVDAGFRVYPAPGLEEALYSRNIQIGRGGTMKRNGARCDLYLNRIWSVRGADSKTYLPCGPHDTRDIEEMRAAAPLPTKQDPSGAEDWEMDQKPGITMLIGGGDAARYSVQRDWLEWFTCNDNGVNASLCHEGTPEFYGIEANPNFTEFTIRADFNNEDSVLGATASIYEAAGTANRTRNNRVQFKLLGRTRESADAAAFWALPDTKARCAKIRELLPAEKRATAPK